MLYIKVPFTATSSVFLQSEDEEEDGEEEEEEHEEQPVKTIPLQPTPPSQQPLQPVPAPPSQQPLQPVLAPVTKSEPAQLNPAVPVPLEVTEEEVTLRIVREPGTGLGISIAGGRGSTPYRGTDEVRINTQA